MNETRIQTIRDILTRYAEGRVDRRQAIKMLSAAGIAVAGVAALGRASSAHQDALATPVVGPREDGSNLWKVQVGGMDMANAIDVHGYFPTEITINAGDAIWFQFAPMGMPGFHTVTFTSGGELPGLFAPDIVDGTPVASPEGPPRIQLNPQLLFPDGVQSYDGTGLVNSGFDILRMEEGPYMLTFTTPGTYEYMCAAHSIVMKGTVTVQEAGSELPFDPAAYEAKAQEEFAAMVEQGVAAIA